jgi:hypothetical protein
VLREEQGGGAAKESQKAKSKRKGQKLRAYVHRIASRKPKIAGLGSRRRGIGRVAHCSAAAKTTKIHMPINVHEQKTAE